MDVILVADETKNIEIKAKVILKKMPRAEYEAIMMPYKRLMLQFERDLRKLADNGVISFSIVDKFTKEFARSINLLLIFSTSSSSTICSTTCPKLFIWSTTTSYFTIFWLKPTTATGSTSFNSRFCPTTSKPNCSETQ